MDLLLIRHAEPVRIAEGEVDGPADPHLHQRGHAQAERLAAWLAEERLDAIWSSPMRRAQETTAPVAAVHNVPVVVDDELAEFDRAATSYIPVEEMKATEDPRLQAMIAGDLAGFGAGDPDEFRDRVVGAVERIVGTSPGAKVAVVCHGGVINAYVGHILELPRLMWFEPAYTCINRVAASRSGVRSLLSLNEVAHLRHSGLLLA